MLLTRLRWPLCLSARPWRGRKNSNDLLVKRIKCTCWPSLPARVTKVSSKFKLFAQASGQRRPRMNGHEFSFFHRELQLRKGTHPSIRDVVLSMGAIYFDTSYIPVDSCCAKQAICVSGLSRMFEVQPNIFLFVHTPLLSVYCRFLLHGQWLCVRVKWCGCCTWPIVAKMWNRNTKYLRDIWCCIITEKVVVNPQ